MTKWIGGVLILSLIALMSWAVWTVGTGMREEHLRRSTKNKLKSFGLALHNYHDIYGSLPPAVVEGPDGRAWHSWRALLLPFLEGKSGVDYRMNEPWDSEHNLAQVKLASELFLLPGSSQEAGGCDIFAVVGRRTLWRGRKAMRFEEVAVSPTLVISLVANQEREQIWSNPSEMSDVETFWFIKDPDEKRQPIGVMVLMADGRVLKITAEVSDDVLKKMIVSSRNPHPLNDWPTYLTINPIEFEERELLASNTNQLGRVTVTPSRYAQIGKEKTVVWCAGFQQSWRQAKKIAGVEITGETTLIEELNGDEPMKDLISSDLLDVQSKFEKSENEYRVAVVSVLKKEMSFEEPFLGLKKGIEFSNGVIDQKVRGFGLESKGDDTEAPLWEEMVEVLHYESDDECIVQLNTAGPKGDRIVLSKISPQANLQETWNLAERLIDEPEKKEIRRYVTARENLKIPVLAFDLCSEFDELVGQRVMLGKNSGTITEARQEIQFRLDEYAADMFSVDDFMTGYTDCFEFPPGEVRSYVFDRPFLLAAIEDGSEEPYLLVWVNGPELLEVVGETP